MQAKPQNCERIADDIRDRFRAVKQAHPERLERKLNLSWSNWGFGIEPLHVSAERLQKHGMQYVELHGNHYGDDLGYRVPETARILGDHGLRCAGVCGMFSAENDLSSNSGAAVLEALAERNRP